MALVLTCAKCDQRLSIPDAMRGKQVRCPKCKEVYTVDRKATVGTAPAAAKSPSRLSTPQRPAAAQRPAAPKNAPQSRTTRCPKCSVQMRLPAQAGTTTFQCPKCSTKLTVREPQAGNPPVATIMSAPSPAARPASTPRPAVAATGDSLFGNLPSSPAAPYPPSRRPVTGPVRQNAYAAPAPLEPPAAGRSAISRAGKSSLLWQGLLIAMANVLSLLVLFALIAAVFSFDKSKTFSTEIGPLLVFGAVIVNYLLVIIGAIGMMRGAPRWLNITTCIVAILPTILWFAPCLGFFLYPVALGGAVWGLISLFSSSPSQPAYAGGGYNQTGPAPSPTYHAASGHLEQAQREVSRKKSSSGDGGSTLGAIAYLIGGVVFIGFAIACTVLIVMVFLGEAEARKPFKAIAGVIFCGTTGFSLLAKGISQLQNRR